MKKEVILKAEVLDPFVNFVTQTVEFFNVVGEATEDKKIKFLEWFSIVREGSDVFQALRELRGVDVENITDYQIEEVSWIIFQEVEGKVKFVREDIVSSLKMAREMIAMIQRDR